MTPAVPPPEPHLPRCGLASTQERKPRLVLADDHQGLLDLLRDLLSAAYEVVAAVSDGEALVQAVIDLEPDLVLTDIGMPRMNGLDALVRIRSLPARARIVIYTIEQDLDTATEALRRGASGYVAKTAPFSALLDALRAALAGSAQVVLR